jgi:hypothetical protein
MLIVLALSEVKGIIIFTGYVKLIFTPHCRGWCSFLATPPADSKHPIPKAESRWEKRSTPTVPAKRNSETHCCRYPSWC